MFAIKSEIQNVHKENIIISLLLTENPEVHKTQPMYLTSPPLRSTTITLNTTAVTVTGRLCHTEIFTNQFTGKIIIIMDLAQKIFRNIKENQEDKPQRKQHCPNVENSLVSQETQES